MNRSDRLLAILLEFQRRNVVRSNELATEFETSVRTIYRDIQALCEADVPIIATPGKGYSLIEGYFLPPVSFTVVQGSWMLVAHCDLRHDIRHFHLSRMTELIVLEDRFELPILFNLRDYTPPDDL